jgi:23S rRNA (uracil1939-C5)-methyltransferase
MRRRWLGQCMELELQIERLGACGGCALQHFERNAYFRWKREQVIAALKSRGLEATVEEVWAVPLGSRRRAVFTLTRGRPGPVLGYHAARSTQVLDIELCPVLVPRIVESLSGLKRAFAPLLPKKGELRLTVTETRSGLDVVVEWARVSSQALAALPAAAEGLGVARVSVNSELALLRSDPVIEFSGASVSLPPGAFLQASDEAEAKLTALVLEAGAGARRAADLFAGLGPFTFSLARQAEVDAFELDGPALEALCKAAHRTQGLKPVRALARDLFRNPLSPRELARFDFVVLDPPRPPAPKHSPRP